MAEFGFRRLANIGFGDVFSLVNLGNFYYQWIRDITQNIPYDDYLKNANLLQRLSEYMVTSYNYAIFVKEDKIPVICFRRAGEISKKMLQNFEDSTRFYETYLRKAANEPEETLQKIRLEIAENKILQKFSDLISSNEEVFLHQRGNKSKTMLILHEWEQNLAKLSKNSSFFPHFYTVLGRLHQTLEQFETAYNIFKDLYYHYSQCVDVSKDLIIEAFRSGNLEEILEYSELALRRHPGDLEVLSMLSLLFIN